VSNFLKQFDSGRWTRFQLPGAMEGLNLHIDTKYTSCSLQNVTNYFNFLIKFMKGVGGAIPSIVSHGLNFAEDEWKNQLIDEAKNELSDEELKRIFNSCLTGVQIYLVGFDAPPYIKDADSIEGNSSWTLKAEEFERDKIAFDVSNWCLVIFVSNLPTVFRDNYENQSDKLFSVGRTRVLVHELVHGMRMCQRMRTCFHDLTWVHPDQFNGDWGVAVNDVSDKLFTPPKLSEVQILAKKNSRYPADAGRSWEHSITEGAAIFEGDFKLVVVWLKNSKNADSTDEVETVCEGRAFSIDEIIRIFDKPSDLRVIAQAKVQQVMSSASASYQIAKYVSCSTTLLKFPFQCQSSLGWQLQNRSTS
jgi:hypothetical protein